VVTSTDPPGGLGSREISDKVGGHRGSSIYHIDHDVLARLEPDLILTQDLVYVCAVSYTVVNDVVRAMDLDARVRSLEPRRSTAPLSVVDTVAAAIGREP
jgi:iron complex transport system substrate-binding protein